MNFDWEAAVPGWEVVATSGATLVATFLGVWLAFVLARRSTARDTRRRIAVDMRGLIDETAYMVSEKKRDEPLSAMETVFTSRSGEISNSVRVIDSRMSTWLAGQRQIIHGMKEGDVATSVEQQGIVDFVKMAEAKVSEWEKGRLDSAWLDGEVAAMREAWNAEQGAEPIP